MKASFYKTLIVGLVCILSTSCGEGGPKFTVEGTITDANSAMLYLEQNSLDKNMVIDSIKIASDGSFKFSKKGTNYPEFYTLRLEEQTINLAIDSADIVKIVANKKDFSSNYQVEGGEGNADIRELTLAHHKLHYAINALNLETEITEQEYAESILKYVDEYKATAVKVISRDYKSPAAYFPLFQKIDDLLIFDPSDKQDMIQFRAVATAWDQFVPNSPRSNHLKDFVIEHLASDKRQKLNEQKLRERIENETDGNYSFDIDLKNPMGENVKLSDLKGKIVLLNFTRYKTEQSPTYNMQLNKLYKAAGANFEIYQVSLDGDLHLWKNTVNHLPWICVRDPRASGSVLLKQFNIESLPTSFLIDKNGDIVKRISDKDNVLREINKLR